MLEKGDLDLRARLDPREDTESRDEIATIYKEIIAGEAEVAIRVGGNNPMAMLVEKTKLYDRIYK